MNAALIRHARRLFYGQALVKQTQTVLTPKPRHKNAPPGVPILGPPKQATRTSHADGHSSTKRNLLGFSTLEREFFHYLLWCQLIRCLGMRNCRHESEECGAGMMEIAVGQCTFVMRRISRCFFCLICFDNAFFSARRASYSEFNSCNSRISTSSPNFA